MIARRIAGFSLALALAAVPAFGQSAPKKITTVEGITEYRLDNGLRVLLFPDASRPKVTVNMTVLVGSRHEGYGEAGMAHLLEHMVFKGTPSYPDIPAEFKERGAQWNGSTSVDRTNYFETLPASDDNLEFGIKLEADRLVNCPIRASDLATEFSVVRNEFESGENSPQRVLNQRMQAVAYEWHNYGKSTIGNRADIERVPPDSLRAFYKKYYQPDKAVLVVAGRFDEKKALDLITKYCGAIPRPTRELPQTYTEEPAQDGERVVTLRRVGDVSIAGLLYHVPAASHPQFPALQVLASILSTQPSGRLYKALVESKKAASVSASASPLHDPGVFEVFADVDTRDSAVLDKVRDEMTAIVEGVAQTDITQAEVDRARARLLAFRELAAADTSTLAIQLSNWAAQGDWRLYFLNRDRLEQVTPEQVKEVASKYLTTSNRTVGLFLPTKQPERTPVPAAPDLGSQVEGYRGRQASAEGELVSTDPTAIEARIQRPSPIGSIKVALLPKKTRGGLVNVDLTLHFGNADNLKGLTEVCSFMGPLMSRETKSLSRQELQDILDKNVARLASFSGVGTLSVSLQTKRENLPKILDVLRQVLREPTFPESEFETLKAQRIARAEESRTEPRRIAAERLARLISKYPPDDVRYVPTTEEEIERLKAVTLDQVRGLYRDYLGAEHGELAIVGDFEPSEILPLLEPMLSGWKAAKPYARIERPYQRGIDAVRDSIVTPDKANATYSGAIVLQMSDSDPDYPAMAIANYVLGGGALSSRIGNRLRQKEGLSYGAGSGFQAPSLDDQASLRLFAIFNPMNVGKVIRGMDEELEKFVKDGVSAEELAKARVGYLNQRNVGRSNDRQLVGMLSDQLFNGRTMQFEADLEARIRALTPEALNAAIRKHLDPKKLIVITAGDFKPETGGGR